MSPGLFVQMTGRGLRPVYAPGFDLETREGRLAALAAGPKPNCLVLDYGGNIERHGPVTHITPPSRKGARRKGEEPQPKVKICELCRTAWPLGTRECAECGHEMIVERDPLAKLEQKASDAEIIMSHEEWLEKNTVWAEVDSVKYVRHRKEGKPDSMRVEYRCGLMKYSEWVCLDHPGYAGMKGRNWWNARSPEEHKIPMDLRCDYPILTSWALEHGDKLPVPARVRVRRNGQHFEVIEYGFGNREETANGQPDPAPSPEAIPAFSA